MDKKTLLIVCSDPLVIAQHLIELSHHLNDEFAVAFATNTTNLSVYPSLTHLVDKYPFHHIPISRKPSLLDPFSVIRLLILLITYRPQVLVSFTPKGGFVSP